MLLVTVGRKCSMRRSMSNKTSIDKSASILLQMIKLNHMNFVLNVNKAAQNPCQIVYIVLDVVDLIICETA